MTELDIWQTFNMGQAAAGAHFIGVAFFGLGGTSSIVKYSQ